MSKPSKSHAKKIKTFQGRYPDGRKAFAEAKRKAGIKGVTKHSEVFGKLK